MKSKLFHHARAGWASTLLACLFLVACGGGGASSPSALSNSADPAAVVSMARAGMTTGNEVIGGTFCSGTTLVQWYTTTGRQTIAAYNAPACGGAASLTETLGGQFCSGTTLVSWFLPKGRQEPAQTNSTLCGAPAETVGGQFCSGTTLVYWYKPTGRQAVAERNSSQCGAPAETLGGQFCSGTTLINWYTPTGRQSVVATNSTQCGASSPSSPSSPSAPSAPSGPSGTTGDYSTSFSYDETGETSFQLTASKPNHLDVNEKFTLTKPTEIWAFVSVQYTAKVYALDATNAQLFLNGSGFRGYELNPAGGDAMNFLTLPAGTYWLGTVPGQQVTANYKNSVYHEVSFNHNINKWYAVNNIPMTASGNAGAWQSQGFVTPTGDWRAFIETEGYGGKFMLMDSSQYSNFSRTYANGYTGGSYSYIYACGGKNGDAATEIECEMKLASGTNYYLVYINDTGSWAGGAANMVFYRPN